MKLSPREIALLGILILVSGGYMLDLMVFKPLQAQISSLTAENMKLNQQIQVLAQQQSQYADTEQQQRLLAEYGMMRAKIPSEPLIPGIMNFLELKAQETKVVIQLVQCKDNLPTDSSQPRQNSADPPLLQHINFQIRVQGSYFNLLSFLMQIETAPRIFTINSCALNSRPESDYPSGADNEKAEEIPGTKLTESPAWPESEIADRYFLDLDFSAYYMESQQ